MFMKTDDRILKKICKCVASWYLNNYFKPPRQDLSCLQQSRYLVYRKDGIWIQGKDVDG